MTENQGKTRAHTTEVLIDATPEQVWDALTKPEQITAWYVPEADVKPGVGGEYAVSWGEGMAGTGAIEIWEPGKRLRMRHQPPPGADEATLIKEGATPVYEDYTITTEKGQTKLTLVFSGVSCDPAFDMEFEGTRTGWASYFRTLKVYLEEHAAKRGHVSWKMMMPSNAEEAFAKLVGPEGLAAKGSLADKKLGEAFDITTSDGVKLKGVVRRREDTAIGLLVTNHPAYIELYFGVTAGMCGGGYMMSVWGQDAATAERIRGEWDALLDRLFPMDPEMMKLMMGGVPEGEPA